MTSRGLGGPSQDRLSVQWDQPGRVGFDTVLSGEEVERYAHCWVSRIRTLRFSHKPGLSVAERLPVESAPSGGPLRPAMR